MRNVATRVVLWFTAVPALFALVIFLPQLHHLGFNIAVIVFAGLGASELATLFERKDAGYRASFVIIPLLGALFPVAEVLYLNGVIPDGSTRVIIYAVVAIVLFGQVFRRAEGDFRHALTNAAANVALLFYPGFFLAYIVRLSSFPHASVIVLSFLCSVMFNDTMAYIAGGTYRLIRGRISARTGRPWSPKVLFPVSPKKTIVGFIGGLAMTPISLLSARAIFPEAFPTTTLGIIVLGIAVGVAVILGDLIESALKRSATSKDSGQLIPGRGGILDSVDSVLFAAPVFYYLLCYAI